MKRPTWEETFMEELTVYEKRVTCKYYKIAALLAVDNRVVSIGYNGPVRGDSHCIEVGCAKEVNGIMLPPNSNLCRGVHGEINVFLNMIYQGISVDMSKATLFTTVRPCWDCAKAIVNSGIKRVIYRKEYDIDEQVAGFFMDKGVKLIKFDSISNVKFG